MVPLFKHLDREDAQNFSLVLDAVGIGHRLVGTNNRFRIEVPEPLADPARLAIQRYQAENAIPPIEPATRRHRPVPLPLSGAGVALILFAVHLAVAGSQTPQDYHRVFGADARLIMEGQLYRCATALVMHADATHIAANMAGVALFGTALCTITGTGMGWLMILACGILGNFMTAWAYGRHHLSVGASTAIFGALGMLCGIQAITAMRTGKGWKQVMLIAGAGGALLAFLGAGTQSDIGAHLFGWGTGVLIGGIHGALFNQPLNKRWQVAGGMIATLTLLLSWIRGVAG